MTLSPISGIVTKLHFGMVVKGTKKYMNDPIPDNESTVIDNGVVEIISLIEQEREREIITRRFGLYERKETLEQIGEILGITRERVRQLEKAILTKLKNSSSSTSGSSIEKLEKIIVKHLFEAGRVSRIDSLGDSIYNKPTNQKERARLTFLATLSPNITLLSETDDYHQSIGIAEYGNEAQLRSKIDEIIQLVKTHSEPIKVDELFTQLSYEHPSQVAAMASLSKHLSQLNYQWGLTKWPSVNPRNIRDKIFVILQSNEKPMHFSDIAKSIKASGFKRKDVTTQAIHNELIKDNRFVLIGRGIYALSSWGYSRGTVADIIENVLKTANEPLHRDEIVRLVLRSRHVKETTILLNLQSKPQFKRVAKATYQLTPSNSQG